MWAAAVAVAVLVIFNLDGGAGQISGLNLGTAAALGVAGSTFLRQPTAMRGQCILFLSSLPLLPPATTAVFGSFLSSLYPWP